MAIYKLVLPRMGESVAEATITGWLKSVGDEIEEDESIIEVATDKVDSDIPSPVNGVLKERLCEEGDVIQVGQTIAIIETEAEEESMEDGSSEELEQEEATEVFSEEEVDFEDMPGVEI